MATEQIVRISRISFSQFKALARYSLSLDHTNILVGPNNSGKSTIIGAIRALANGLRAARSKTPERLETDSGRELGYRISEANLPISLENVHTNYGSVDSRVTFDLSNGNKLHLKFPSDGGCILVPEVNGIAVSTPSIFKKHFPISIVVVPVLGPVEHKEKRLEEATVVNGLSTHRASRHFRNYWQHFPSGFEEFSQLIRSTWPGMNILPPEINMNTGELVMFCEEDRIIRELYWVGFGFQVWCQLLTHIARAKDCSLFVIDEPEVYLHPDIQRQLLGIVRQASPNVLLATHSTEIMSEADPSEIILVDKKRQSSERLRDVAGVQRALEIIGSIQNITLTGLARNRRVLFVEGDYDFRLLRRFANRFGLSALGTGLGLTPLESGGFGSWKRITTLAAGVSEALGAPLMIAAIYDPDYFCQEELSEVKGALAKTLKLAHVHSRKEIENYLLIPAALDRAISRAIKERSAPMSEIRLPESFSEKLLDEITQEMKDDAQSNYVGKRVTYLRDSGSDATTLTKDALAWFNPQWNNFSSRMCLVPGKEVLRRFREVVQSRFGVSLSDARIVDAIHKDEIPSDLVELLNKVEKFRTTQLTVA